MLFRSRRGSLLDADGDDATVDVTSLGLRLNAAVGVGTLGVGSNALETTVDTVSARATSGGINLLETDGVTVDDVTVSTSRVQSDASVLPVVDATQSDLATLSGDGSVVLRSQGGAITLNDGTAGGGAVRIGRASCRERVSKQV